MSTDLRKRLIEPPRFTAISSDDITIQQYLSPANLYMEKIINLSAYSGSLFQQTYLSRSLHNKEDRLFSFAPQIVQPPSISTTLLPLASTRLQLEQKQHSESKNLSTGSANLHHSAVSSIESVLLAFIKTLSKRLLLSISFSVLWKRIGLTLELKTHVKCD